MDEIIHAGADFSAHIDDDFIEKFSAGMVP
jgi:hypothetical protein